MFEFTGLAKGAYRLSVEVPDTLDRRAAGERTIELPDEHACLKADYALPPSGRITGRVLDASDGRRNRSPSRPTSPTRADNRRACRC